MRDALPRLEHVEYRLGEERIEPFNPSERYFEARAAFDRERMHDLLAAVLRHHTGRKLLDLAAAPYILDAALLAAGFEVSLNGLPFGEIENGSACLTVEGVAYECALDLFDAEGGAFPYVDGAFDVVVAGEIFEHLYRRPWHMLAETWRCLSDEGVLVLSTPNAESLERLYGWLRRLPSGLGFNPDAPTVRHAREYGPAEIDAILQSQGFDVVEIHTPSYIHVSGGFEGLSGPLKRGAHRLLKHLASRQRGPLARRGDTIIAVARKNAARKPGDAPAFMVYATGDPRSGYNFPSESSSTVPWLIARAPPGGSMRP